MLGLKAPPVSKVSTVITVAPNRLAERQMDRRDEVAWAY